MNGGEQIQNSQNSLDVIIQKLGQIQIDQSEISHRLGALENSPKYTGNFSQSDSVSRDNSANGTLHHDTSANVLGAHSDVQQQPVGPTVNSAADLQREFEIIKDSFARTRLPTELRVFDSKQGIKADCQSTLNILSRSARFTETALKWFQQNTGADRRPGPGTEATVLNEDQLGQLYVILAAQINFLQGEYAGLLVRSTFDENTSKFFKTLEKNTTVFSGQALDNLRNAAEIAAIQNRVQHQPATGRFQRGPFGRQWRGGRYRGNFGSYRGSDSGFWNNSSQDNGYNGNRSFPTSRRRADE